MSQNIEAAVAALERLTVGQLRQRYAEVFGEPTRSHHKRHLVRRIGWRLQAIREGDLSERAKQRALELARDADLRTTGPRKPPTPLNEERTIVTAPLRATAQPRLTPGTLLKRAYKGRSLIVRVLSEGFEFEGQVYRSLSAIAQHVTGSHWSGNRFFGLTQEKP